MSRKSLNLPSNGFCLTQTLTCEVFFCYTSGGSEQCSNLGFVCPMLILFMQECQITLHLFACQTIMLCPYLSTQNVSSLLPATEISNSLSLHLY